MDEEIDRMRRQSLQTHSSEIQRGEVDRATGAASPEKRGSAEKRGGLAGVIRSVAGVANKDTLSAAASWLGVVGSKLLTSAGGGPGSGGSNSSHGGGGGGGGGRKDPDDLDSIVDAADACAALRRAVEVKREPQAVAALDIMSAMAEREGAHTVLALGAGGACGYVDQLLQWRNTSSAICESGLRAVCSLASEEKNRLRFVAGGTCHRIVKAAQVQIHDDIVLEWGLRVLRYLALDEASVSKVIACGACEVVSAALNTYAHNDSVVEWSCRIIFGLAHDDDISQDKFAAGDTCAAIVVGVLQERREALPLSVAIWSLRAIGSLARRHQRNKERLANLGACELTMQLLQRFGHENATFAESLCWAVGNLAFPDETTQARLAAAGACTDVVRALEHHLSNPEMAQEGFRALRNLGHMHEANLQLLAEAEACDVVMRGIKLYGQTPEGSGTLQWGWFAVASLSDRKENLQLLGAAGACQELVRTISRFGASPDVAQWACLALSKLAQDPDISKYVGYEGACRGVTQILIAHVASAEVAEECLNAMASLSSHEDGKNREIFAEAGVADVLVKALTRHEKEEAVGEQGCWALACLIADASRPSGAALVSKLVASGICKALPKIISRHAANDRIAEYGCQALALLSSTGNAAYLAKLGSGGAAGAVVAALQMHASNPVICRWVLQAVRNLSADEGCLVKLCSPGAPITVSRCLQIHHARSEELARLAMLALAGLAQDEGCRTKLGSLEGCAEAIIAALYAHPDNDVLAICACDIITEMCRSADPQAAPSGGALGTPASSSAAASFISFSDSVVPAAERLGLIGIASALAMSLARHHGNVAAVSAASRAIEALCTGEGSDANRGKLAQSGVCPLLMQVLHAHIEDGSSQFTVSTSSVCLALAGLMREGKHQADNQSLLASLQAAEDLKVILGRYADNPLVTQSCCKALSFLASGNAATQSGMLACGATEAVVRVFRRYVDNEAVIAQAALAVAEVSLGHADNSSVCGKLGVCKDLVAVLLKHRRSEAVCESCCRAVFSLKDQNILLGAAGACEAVLSILAQHPGSEAVAQWVCRAIGSLAENQNNKKILGASSACEVITAALQRHVANETLLSVVLMRNTSSAGVAQWGCAAMYLLARGQGKLEEEYRRKLVAAGACEAVAKALVKYSEVEAVAQTCCRAVVVLAEGRDREAHAVRLGSLGVCATVVDSLHLFPSSVPVAKWGCRAVAVLAEGCEANVVRLVAAGCCEVVPVAMQAHQTSEAVAGAGCDALTSLAANVRSGYAARLGHTGACESVVSVLRRHAENADVVERGCRAMANLALVKGNSSWFGPAGACDALLRVQQNHPNNETLAAAAWLAAGSLCVDSNNRHRLGQAGACEQIVASMDTLLQFPAVAKAAGTAIGKLCELGPAPSSRSHQDLAEIPRSTGGDASSPETPADSAASGHRENRERLFKAGCCEVVVSALRRHVAEAADGPADVGVAFSLCRTVGILAKGVHSHQEREQFGQVGACAAVVQAMQRFPGHEGVARCGCLAIRALAFDHVANKVALRAAGGCEAVVLAMRKHSTTPSAALVHEAAAWALSNLAQDSPENKALLGTLGAVEATLDAFEMHGRYIEVARWCCSALRHLCDGNEANRSKISFSSAAELLCQAVHKYGPDDELVEAALLTMVVVCADRVGQHRLGLVGVCKAVVPILQRSDAIASLACELISALSFKSGDNQSKLGQAGACKAVLQTLEAVLMRSELTSGAISRKASSYTVLDTMKDLASAVFVSQADQQDRGGAATALSNPETTSPGTDGPNGVRPSTGALVEVCLGALHGLATGHEGNRRRLVSLGAIDLVSALLNLHCLGEAVKERAQAFLEAGECVSLRQW